MASQPMKKIVDDLPAKFDALGMRPDSPSKTTFAQIPKRFPGPNPIPGYNGVPAYGFPDPYWNSQRPYARGPSNNPGRPGPSGPQGHSGYDAPFGPYGGGYNGPFGPYGYSAKELALHRTTGRNSYQ
ncbi:hypothetical protein E4U59_002077 [Claviceps monticola]|nr:hypothetical protein E4U59_002077 [Claviceps monticola]